MTDLPRADYLRVRADYRRRYTGGEHTLILGPTGTGKTALMSNLIANQKYVLYIASKGRDKTVSELLLKCGYIRIQSVKELAKRDRAPHLQRLVFWPEVKSLQQSAQVGAEIRNLLDYAYQDGVWIVAVDDAERVCDDLGCGDEVRTMLQMSRSQGVSMIISSQRPAWLPVTSYDSASYKFSFSSDEPTDNRRNAAIVGLTANEWAGARLALREFVYRARGARPYRAVMPWPPPG